MEETMQEPVRVPASRTAFVTRRVAMPSMLNAVGIVFGGNLLSIYDECAGISALALTNSPVATVSIEKVTFTRPVHSGETIVVRSRVVYTGRTSLVVKISAAAEMMGIYRGEIGEAVFHFVGIDENGRPHPVPQLLLETDEDRQLWAEAEAARKQRA